MSKLRRVRSEALYQRSLPRSASFTILLKICGVGFAFVASLVYARALGPEGYGLYAYALAISTLLAVPAALGLPQYLVREGARIPDASRLLRRWADQYAVAGGGAAAAFLIALALLAADQPERLILLIAAPLPLLTSVGSIRRALLQAHGWTARSQYPYLVLAPALMLLVILILWRTQGSLSPIQLMIVTVLGALVPLLVNSVQLRFSTRRVAPTRQAPKPRLTDALAFMWLGGLYLLINRTDVIMLGAMAGPTEAGLYAVASRAAELVSLFLLSVNMVIAPRIAQLHAAGDHAAIQRLVTTTLRGVLLITLPVAAVLLIGATPLLELLYGSAYSGASGILKILTLAQLILVLGGPMGTLLEMTGHERKSMWVLALVALSNIALNAILIPRWDSHGAAIATCLSVTLGRILLWRVVRKALSFKPTVFGA